MPIPFEESQIKAIPDSYWVLPGRFLAGEYPCSLDEIQAQRKVRWLLKNGVNYYLDLTEAGEAGLIPYAPLLFEEAATLEREVTYRRMPIADMSAPTPAAMTCILDVLDAAIESSRIVYTHCYGGVGRTGTVVGCYLVRHGLPGQQAIQYIARLRQGTPDGWKRSPEMDVQRQLILLWKKGQ
jgi:hypothetical protein